MNVFEKEKIPFLYDGLLADQYCSAVNSIKTPKELSVRKIPNTEANAFVERHHYLKRKIYIAKNISYGLFAGDYICGVIMFGYPVWTTFPGICPPYKHGSTPELIRLCTMGGLPRNSESWFCSKAIKFLIKDWFEITSIEVCGITSLCDVAYGFNGSLYKALNFIEHKRGAIGRPTNPGGAHGKWGVNTYTQKPEKIMYFLKLKNVDN